jgi:hypothetical protein
VIRNVGVGALALLLLAGCGRKTDFLYYIKDVPLQTFSGTHKLKELQGETKVDILWTIDNSGSMGSYQQALISESKTFINDFVNKGGLEWKMGIISSTLTDQPFVGFTPSTLLTYQTTNGIALFQDAVGRLGTFGDATERFFSPVDTALQKFPDFVRKNATLAIIFLTDAPDQGAMKAPDFLKMLTALKGDLGRVVVYGVFAALDLGCTAVDEQWNYAGSGYETVIKATKGQRYKLCNTPFGKNLADLGTNLVERIKRPFIQLKDRPVVSSLTVNHLGVDLQGGAKEQGGIWVYDFDMNRVVFHNLDFAPGDNEEVTIRYVVADEIVR